MELVTSVKCFTVQAHGKERVDMSEHMLKVTIMTKCLDVISYDCKKFTVQAHGIEWADMSEHTLKVTNNDKKPRLYQNGIIYDCKNLYSTGSW
jgi:hypothetical protein